MSNTKNDMQQVTLRTAVDSVRMAIELQDPIMLWGLMGIGKSAIVKQVAKEMDRELIDIRLTTLDPTEFSGIPYYDSNSEVLKRAVSDLFPKDSKSDAIVLLDELPDAAPSMQSAAYRLVLDRELGNGVKLPDGVAILAAGNTASSHGGGGNMLSPLANRLDHLEVVCNTQEFLEDFGYENLHPTVTSFLRKDPTAIHSYESKSQKAFATPRSWEKVSNKLFSLEKKYGKKFINNASTLTAVASGVGVGMSAKFKSHLLLDGKLPDMQDILEGKAKDMDKDLMKEAGIKYLLTSNIISAAFQLAKDENDGWQDKLGNALSYLDRNKDGEDMSILVLSTIYSNKGYLGEKLVQSNQLKNFLTPEVQDVIISACQLDD